MRNIVVLELIGMAFGVDLLHDYDNLVKNTYLGSEEMKPDYVNIGGRLPRVDGIVKAAGEAMYAGDLSLPGMLHGRLLRSPHPHARLLGIDTSAATALPGVRAVITGKRHVGVPGRRHRHPGRRAVLGPGQGPLRRRRGGGGGRG